MKNLKNLSDFYGKIPSLKGNEGLGDAIADEEENTSAVTLTQKLTQNVNTTGKVNKETTTETLPWEDEPKVVTKSTNKQNSDTVSFSDFVKGPTQKTTPYQQPMNNPYQPYYTPHSMYTQQKPPNPFAAAFQTTNTTMNTNSVYGQYNSNGYNYGNTTSLI